MVKASPQSAPKHGKTDARFRRKLGGNEGIINISYRKGRSRLAQTYYALQLRLLKASGTADVKNYVKLT
jgi:hypothetical protein